MYNWSVDEKKFKKENPKKYKLWRLTQLINYGLGNEKLDKRTVIRAWPKIHNRLDPNVRTYLQYLLWGKIPSSKDITQNFWNLS